MSSEDFTDLLEVPFVEITNPPLSIDGEFFLFRLDSNPRWYDTRFGIMRGFGRRWNGLEVIWVWNGTEPELFTYAIRKEGAEPFLSKKFYKTITDVQVMLFAKAMIMAGKASREDMLAWVKKREKA